jgi:hypothetical protein
VMFLAGSKNCRKRNIGTVEALISVNRLPNVLYTTVLFYLRCTVPLGKRAVLDCPPSLSPALHSAHEGTPRGM